MRVESYDQGYRDGWHDVRRCVERKRKSRLARRRKNAEYGLGYDHGFIDGVGRTWDWRPGFWGPFAQG